MMQPTQVQSSKPQDWVTIYVLYNASNTKWHRHVSKRFFMQNAHELKVHVLDKPIFFHPKEALEYCRFLTDKFLILEIVVPQIAIQGGGSCLGLRSDYLQLGCEHCLGLYPSWQSGREYIDNPVASPELPAELEVH